MIPGGATVIIGEPRLEGLGQAVFVARTQRGLFGHWEGYWDPELRRRSGEHDADRLRLPELRGRREDRFRHLDIVAQHHAETGTGRTGETHDPVRCLRLDHFFEPPEIPAIERMMDRPIETRHRLPPDRDQFAGGILREAAQEMAREESSRTDDEQPGLHLVPGRKRSRPSSKRRVASS